MDNQNQTQEAVTNQTVAQQEVPVGQQPPVTPAVESPATTSPSPVIPPSSPPTYVLFIVGALVIVIVAVGLWMFVGSRSSQPEEPMTSPTSQITKPTTIPTSVVEPTLSTSDDVTSLEKDASSTNLEDLNKDDAEINRELQGL